MQERAGEGPEAGEGREEGLGVVAVADNCPRWKVVSERMMQMGEGGDCGRGLTDVREVLVVELDGAVRQAG